MCNHSNIWHHLANLNHHRPSGLRRDLVLLISMVPGVLFVLPLQLPLIKRLIWRVVLLYRFGIFFCGQVLLEILEQHLKVIVYACGDWPSGLSKLDSNDDNIKDIHFINSCLDREWTLILLHLVRRTRHSTNNEPQRILMIYPDQSFGDARKDICNIAVADMLEATI